MIECYLSSLEELVKIETDRKHEKAQLLLDRYKKAIEPQDQHWGTGDLREPRPDRELARKWENERARKQVHLNQPTFFEYGSIHGSIHGTVNGTIAGGTFTAGPKREREEIQDDDKVQKRTRIDDYFSVRDVPQQEQQPRTPEHQIHPSDNVTNYYNVNEVIYINGIQFSQEVTTFICTTLTLRCTLSDLCSTSQNATEEIHKIITKLKKSDYRLFQYKIINLSDRNASSPVQKFLTKADKQLLKKIWDSLEPLKEDFKTIRQDKWNQVIKPLVKKYQKNLEPKSLFDDFPLDLAIDEVTERPYTGTINYKEHHDLLWVQEIYKRLENFINPIIAKLFDDVMDIIRVKTGEIENILNKIQRVETRQYMQRVSIGCHQDGIFEVNINATTFEIGFLEVIGNALIVDIKKLNGDLDKVLKAMQISLFYQRQHHIQRGATDDLLTCLESYGIIVYQRIFTIYIMHITSGGLYIVDKLTEFCIPNSKDQLYTMEEIIEKVYMFKSRIMDYCLKIRKITPNYVQPHINTTESPVKASPSKNSKIE
ncbi:5637_t:CDS:10 [Diversispora eburnea]|uniref:5637_t:CDS:1 n=1 Tax=Diversispora eburnea TaxID=1213867 RepID=A0A9N9CF30_9GLOM|nr:5637_t:CDS:10 [Diversispora eburnea]